MDLVVVVWSTLKNQENQKARKRLSPENWLSLKNSQKVGIHLILMLWKLA